MGKASRAKRDRRQVRNPAVAYLDWLQSQPPGPHNCDPRPVRPPYPGPLANRVVHGVCRCGRRWKATIGREAWNLGRVLGWEPADG